MKEEKVFFKDKKGRKVVGVLDIPTGKGPFPAVIMLHGLNSNKDRPSYLNPAKELCSKGIVAFRFDLFGHGESDGNPEDITISTGVDSLKAGLEFIRKQDFVDKSKLGIYGASYGGAIAIAGFNSQFKAVVLKCPASNYKKTREIQLGKEGLNKWKETGIAIIGTYKHKLKYSFWEDLLKNHKQYEEAERIDAPTLIIQGDKDITVLLEHSKELNKHIKSDKRLEIIKGAGHQFEKPEQYGKVQKLIVNWFVKYLK